MGRSRAARNTGCGEATTNIILKIQKSCKSRSELHPIHKVWKEARLKNRIDLARQVVVAL